MHIVLAQGTWFRQKIKITVAEFKMYKTQTFAFNNNAYALVVNAHFSNNCKTTLNTYKIWI